jgi:hypothetical protein
MAREQARTDHREALHGREVLHGREDLHRRENFHDDLPKGGISPEKISRRTHPERPPERGISPEVISGG